MKALEIRLAAFAAIFWLAQARVIHLDINVAKDSHVNVDVDLNPKDSQRTEDLIEDDYNLQHLSETQQVVTAGYDIELPYEVHRGLLSVIATFTHRGTSLIIDRRMIAVT